MPQTQNFPECIEINESGQTPTHAVIWMHGLGADAHDFVPLVPHIELPDSIALKYVFPNARLRPITINNGMSMRGWYDIVNADFARTKEDEVGLRESLSVVTALINREIERGIPAERIFLAGFSQGCAMTLLTGLRFPKRLAGLICLSGYLPLADNTSKEASTSNKDVPILMAHGEMDQMVPLDRAQASRDYLVELGYQIDWRTYMMAHEICGPEVQAISEFITAHSQDAGRDI